MPPDDGRVVAPPAPEPAAAPPAPPLSDGPPSGADVEREPPVLDGGVFFDAITWPSSPQAPTRTSNAAHGAPTQMNFVVVTSALCREGRNWTNRGRWKGPDGLPRGRPHARSSVLRRNRSGCVPRKDR